MSTPPELPSQAELYQVVDKVFDPENMEKAPENFQEIFKGMQQGMRQESDQRLSEETPGPEEFRRFFGNMMSELALSIWAINGTEDIDMRVKGALEEIVSRFGQETERRIKEVLIEPLTAELDELISSIGVENKYTPELEEALSDMTTISLEGASTDTLREIFASKLKGILFWDVVVGHLPKEKRHVIAHVCTEQEAKASQ